MASFTRKPNASDMESWAATYGSYSVHAGDELVAINSLGGPAVVGRGAESPLHERWIRNVVRGFEHHALFADPTGKDAQIAQVDLNCSRRQPARNPARHHELHMTAAQTRREHLVVPFVVATQFGEEGEKEVRPPFHRFERDALGFHRVIVVVTLRMSFSSRFQSLPFECIAISSVRGESGARSWVK